MTPVAATMPPMPSAPLGSAAPQASAGSSARTARTVPRARPLPARAAPVGAGHGRRHAALFEEDRPLGVSPARRPPPASADHPARAAAAAPSRSRAAARRAGFASFTSGQPPRRPAHGPRPRWFSTPVRAARRSRYSWGRMIGRRQHVPRRRLHLAAEPRRRPRRHPFGRAPPLLAGRAVQRYAVDRPTDRPRTGVPPPPASREPAR